MEGRVDKSQSYHHEIHNTLKGRTVDAIPTNSADLPLGHIASSVVDRYLEESVTPSQTRKRHFDAVSASDLLSAKRNRLAKQVSPDILLWQRCIGGDENPNVEGDGDVNYNSNKVQPDRAQLTRRNLALFNKMETAGEYKGPGGSMEKARLQCAYDGAALVYARNKALELTGKPDPLGHAKITTFATDGKNIDFFAHYASLGDDGKLKYHYLSATGRQRRAICRQVPDHATMGNLNNTRLEPSAKTPGGREDLGGIETRRTIWPARTIACFGILVFVGATVAGFTGAVSDLI
ncbi:hypothetical protein O988_06419 [Pseudogymnoascus sp. VKM F-3808]|nr:hypothetical protein O988_06419 [Pseudogymnoascus sp. VKM F-3808]